MIPPPPGLPVRILSDLHFGNRISMVETAEAVAPLFEGVATVILNGDTFDLRHPQSGEPIETSLCPFGALADRAGCRLIKIAGNHDPDVSGVHHLDLMDGRVLVTHGDVLYPEIAPWSRFAHQFRRMIEDELAELEHPEGHSLEHLLQTNKKVAREILKQPHFYFPTNEGFFRHVLRYLWPPFRFFRILGSWRKMPRSAADLGRIHRPEAQFLVMGHTHLPGIWRNQKRIVINTGSFLPWLGRLCVDIHEDRLEVRRIRKRRGVFSPGRVIRKWTPADSAT